MSGLLQRLITDHPASPATDEVPSRPRYDLVVCDGCDTAYRRQAMDAGQEARCARCEALMGRGHRLGADGQLALALAALIVFIVGNSSPIVTLDLRGVHVPVTLYESILSTWRTGQQEVAVLAAATAFVFPLAVILLRIYVLTPLMLERRPPGFAHAMRLLRWFTRWSMVEVFMLGTLIAVVRSAGIASIILGAGIFSYAALTVLLTANHAAGLHRIWRRSSELPP